MNHKKITLDIERKSFESIIAMQGDNKSRYIDATIVNRSIPVDLTGCTVKFSAIKPDLTDIFNDAVIIDAKGGKVQIELTNQTLAKEGVIQATLVILKEDMQLSVLPFFITVIENPYNPNAIESKPEYQALNNALIVADGYAKELQDASVNLEEKYTTRLNNFGSQLDTIENNIDDIEIKKATHEFVKEEITKAQLEGASVDTDVLVFKSEIETEVKKYSSIFVENLSPTDKCTTLNGVSADGAALSNETTKIIFTPDKTISNPKIIITPKQNFNVGDKYYIRFKFKNRSGSSPFRVGVQTLYSYQTFISTTAINNDIDNVISFIATLNNNDSRLAIIFDYTSYEENTALEVTELEIINISNLKIDTSIDFFERMISDRGFIGQYIIYDINNAFNEKYDSFGNLKNIFLNSNFSDTSKFGAYNGNFSVSDNILTFNPTDKSSRLMQDIDGFLIEGHKYYMSVQMCPKSTVPNNVSFISMYSYNVHESYYYPDIDVFTKIDTVFEMNNNTDTIFGIAINYDDTPINASVDFKELQLINLTESFGEGNEPSLEIIRELLEVSYDGFIENTEVINTPSVLNLIDKNNKNNEAKYSKYKLFTFKPTEGKLITLTSNDGINFKELTNISHTPVTGTCLRDPSVIFVDGYYYMIYSRIQGSPTDLNYVTGKYIGLARSKDLITFEELTPIECEGYYNLWAPEFYKKKDGSYGIVVSCIPDGGDHTVTYWMDIISFEPFSYGVLQEIPTDGLPNHLIDLNMKNINDTYYLSYSAGMKIRMAKQDSDGIFRGYNINASWQDDGVEGSFIIEMEGFYRMYLTYRPSNGSIYYSDSKDLINWGDLKKCNIPTNRPQHCSLIYENENMCHLVNDLINK